MLLAVDMVATHKADSSVVRGRSRRNHLFLDADARFDGALIFKRDGRRVLEGDAGRIENRDLILRDPPLLLTGDDRPDLAGQIALPDKALDRKSVV